MLFAIIVRYQISHLINGDLAFDIAPCKFYQAWGFAETIDILKPDGDLPVLGLLLLRCLALNDIFIKRCSLSSCISHPCRSAIIISCFFRRYFTVNSLLTRVITMAFLLEVGETLASVAALCVKSGNMPLRAMASTTASEGKCRRKQKVLDFLSCLAVFISAKTRHKSFFHVG